MTRHEEGICYLLGLSFFLLIGSCIAFEVDFSILGLILGGFSFLSYLSILWVIRKKKRREEEQDR